MIPVGVAGEYLVCRLPASPPMDSRPQPELEPVGLDWKLSSLQVGLLLGLVLLGRLCALYSCPLYDDAFITLRYAKNLSDGAGMIFNPAAPWEPILGTTTAGFCVFLALFLKFGFDPVHTVLALDVALDLASAAMLVALFRRRLIPTTVTLVLFALLPQIARIGVGGMESPFLVALLLGAALAWRSKRAALTGLFVAIACTVRPEAVLFTVPFGWRFLRTDRKAFLRYAGVIAVVGIVSAGALTAFYGDPFPQSVKAKSTTHSSSDWSEDLGRVGEILRQAFLPTLWLFALVPVALFGCLRSLKERSGLHLFGVAALLQVSSYLLARPHTWGWYYYLPLCAWTVWLGIGVERAWAHYFADRDSTGAQRFANVALAVGVVLSGLGAVFVSKQNPDLVTRNVYAPMEALVSELGITPETRIVASDIGAIAYYADCLVIDSEGLTWPGALEYRGDGPGMMTAQVDIIDAERPDFCVFVAEAPRVAIFRGKPNLASSYEPVARLNVAGDETLDPSLESLPPHWKQDYLVYRRRPAK